MFPALFDGIRESSAFLAKYHYIWNDIEYPISTTSRQPYDPMTYDMCYSYVMVSSVFSY